MACTSTEAPQRGRTKYPHLPVFGLVALCAGVALLGLLHVVPATDGISAVDDTISEYAFTSMQWVFSLGVLLVAAGTTCVFGAVVLNGAARPFSVTSVAAGLWTVGLLLIVVFEKTNWDVGPSMTGTIHRIASIVAFVSLPLAVIAGAGAVFRHARGWRLLSRVLALGSWLGFAVILAAVGRMMVGGPPWWEALPLGLVERALALSAILAVTVLAAGMTTSSAWRISPAFSVPAGAENAGEFRTSSPSHDRA